ncbi:restriction endonuclease [Bacillus sinesaloumensis]|uniref:restriction endonuclease n=1 Tax=Litchfieldia sinesaloumensis TaxID=1926280 RepID=UPI0009887B47|nr:restriction endonuclease [Bacillus sinesaloumensis]
MAVPDYQTIMLPLLKALQDGNEHLLKDIYKQLAAEFQLTEEDLNEVLPSGSQKTFHNRVGWAKTYLQKAGLLRTVSRGRFVITSRGLEVLASNPQYINIKYLTQFEEFMEFRSLSSAEDTEVQASTEVHDNDTPEEILEKSYKRLRDELSTEILNTVKQCSPSFFEKLVVDLLVAMGYGGSKSDAGQAIGKSGDEGIDGIIKEDKLGLDVIYIQAKRWNNTVGRPDVQAFAGSLEGQRAKKGVFITTSRFSNEAKEYVKVIEKKIVLIDGERLTQLMIDYDIGVSEYEKFIVKRIDTDYFNDEEI